MNDKQAEAVQTTEGPLLIMAGAGSGKTRVLTHRIAYLIDEKMINPWNILAITFTNKAAREMKERIASVVGGATASRLWMGTFHSIFSRILRTNAERIGFSRDFTIYDQSDSRSLIKTVIKEMSLDDKVYKPATVQAIISNAKNALITPSAYAANAALIEADMRSKRPLIRDIYKIYWSRCARAGAMDFDDLLLYTNILFRDHPDVLEFYQNQFRYVLVDEYQCRGRRCPEHLFFPGGQYQQYSQSAKGISRFQNLQARTELPLDPDYRCGGKQPYRQEQRADTQAYIFAQCRRNENPRRERLFRF